MVANTNFTLDPVIEPVIAESLVVMGFHWDFQDVAALQFSGLCALIM